ncbi:MAG: D-glycero-beta-D-manno-heptose-7-phosphate kinase [Candidatus Wallbacteria bacterium]|nr:D-glycero-beta-D-manno-heptose-7-phosphate kinase [Candidatus Wallbacteria bacterium]
MERSKLLGRLAELGRPRILVIGDVILDKYLFGNVERLSPEAPVPVLDVVRESYILGGAANVASNLLALEAEVHLCGLAGEDADQERLVGLLAERGLGGAGIFRDPARPTTVKTRVIGQSQQIVRLDRESRQDSSEQMHERLCAYVDSIAESVDGLIVSDYGKGVITPRLLEHLRGLRRRRGVPVVVDPKDIHFQHYRSFSLITPNTAEASLGAGFKIKDERTLLEAGRKLRDELDLEAILITRGAQGMSLFKRDGSMLHIPTMARDVFDVTGAGDTVSSVMGLAVASGLGLEDSAYLANFAASVVVRLFGTATVNRAEIRRAIEQHDGAGL